FEHRLQLAGCAHVKRHQDRGLELAGERLDVFFGFVVEVSYRELGAERPEGLGASPGDRLLVGDADDETSLAFKQPCFDDRNLEPSFGWCLPGLDVAPANVSRPRKGCPRRSASLTCAILPPVDLRREGHDFRSNLFSARRPPL